MRRTLASRIVTGLIIMAIGVLVLGNVAFGWNLGDLSRSWWTLFIFVPAIVGIVSDRPRFWNVFLLLLAFWLLAEDQGWLRGDAWPYFLGGLLVLFGIYVIAGGSRHRHAEESGRHLNEDADDLPEYTSIFTNMHYANKSQGFRGGKASSVFGGLTLDLREITVSGGAVLEVAGVFGSVEILAPKGIPMRVNVTPVFGGFFNEASYPAPAPGQPCLEIRGASVFGSVRIL